MANADRTRSKGAAALQVGMVAGQSAVVSAFATSPMKILVPRPRGSCVWACLSSFGGGLVAGDQTHLDARVGAGARCFIGTQAATRIYRNPSHRPCSHTTRVELDPGALLVFAPDPIQAFADASYEQRQEFILAPDASLVLVDWLSAGRTACGERWAFRHFSSRNTLRFRRGTSRRRPAVSGPPAFLDSIRLDSSDAPLDSLCRGGRFNCLATILLIGPQSRQAAQSLLDDIGRRPVRKTSPLCCSASPVLDGAVLRVAGEQIEDVRHLLAQHLVAFAEPLGDDPWARKGF